MKLSINVITFAILCSISRGGAKPLKEAEIAYRKGRYPEVLAICRGVGKPKALKKALHWYTLAGKSGNKKALSRARALSNKTH